MKYAIYLDNVEIETFFGNDQDALNKFEEYKNEYNGEDIYNDIELFAFRTIKKETL